MPGREFHDVWFAGTIRMSRFDRVARETDRSSIQARFSWCRGWESNPHAACATQDFKFQGRHYAATSADNETLNYRMFRRIMLLRVDASFVAALAKR